MFLVHEICEGVYDLWYHEDDPDYHDHEGEYMGSFDTAEAAWDEADIIENIEKYISSK